jgi:uncharacterized protein YecE (DUF72 family)
MLYLGTSGFSYKDWVGPFYPVGTPLSSMLEFYQEEFSTVELDYTYYAMPAARTMDSFAVRSKPGFIFSVRSHKSITHDKGVSSADILRSSQLFCDALTPLVEAGKLGCVLLQYPWSFRMDSASIDRMLLTASAFSHLKVAVEFRNDSWANDAMLQLLKTNGLALCCVDEPRLPGLFPPLTAVTAGFSYIRFHGRNGKDWWQAKPGGDRYNYDYGDNELEEWVPGIHKLMSNAKDTYIYLNNCHMGNAARNARKLKTKLSANA